VVILRPRESKWLVEDRPGFLTPVSILLGFIGKAERGYKSWLMNVG
jgi:hypothetical protein